MINCKKTQPSGRVHKRDVVIIGAGISGLSAAVHARQAGYPVKVFEKHHLPGGLCTAWSRRGFTFDYCVDYLVGTNPSLDLYDLWLNLGVMEELDFLPVDNFGLYRDKQGNVLNLYTDPERFQDHLLRISPEDEKQIRLLTELMKKGQKIEISSMKIRGNLKRFLRSLPAGISLAKWAKVSLREWCSELKHPLLRLGIPRIVGGEMDFLLAGPFSFFGMMNRGAIACPVGGSLPLARALEKRALSLGAEIHYRSEVEEILVDQGRAVGVRLKEGAFQKAGQVISAVDANHCLKHLLKGAIRSEPYERQFKEAKLYPSILQVSLGVEMASRWELEKLPRKNYLELENPLVIGDRKHEYLSCYQYAQDPRITKGNRTSILLKFEEHHGFWKELKGNPQAYKKAKEQVLTDSLDRLERFFPGISQRTLASDVATPTTCYDYTYNWKGSSQGWQMNSMGDALKNNALPKSFPQLGNFHMIGQWTSPGGGLPIMARQGRDVIALLKRGERG